MALPGKRGLIVDDHGGPLGHWAVRNVAPAERDRVARQGDGFPVLVTTGDNQHGVCVSGYEVQRGIPFKSGRILAEI